MMALGWWRDLSISTIKKIQSPTPTPPLRAKSRHFNRWIDIPIPVFTTDQHCHRRLFTKVHSRKDPGPSNSAKTDKICTNLNESPTWFWGRISRRRGYNQFLTLIIFVVDNFSPNSMPWPPIASKVGKVGTFLKFAPNSNWRQIQIGAKFKLAPNSN